MRQRFELAMSFENHVQYVKPGGPSIAKRRYRATGVKSVNVEPLMEELAGNRTPIGIDLVYRFLGHASGRLLARSPHRGPQSAHAQSAS